MMNLSHISVWHEQLIITQTVLFIPLVLWLVNKFFETGKKIYFFLIPLFLGFCILGGHAQTVIYLYTIALVFMVYRKFSWKQILFCFSIAIGVAALQLIPTLEIYLLSAREGEATRKLFAPYVLPWKYLITIFVPDFFGNPATGNFWGRNYSDFQIFSGVSATAFAFMAIYHEWKKTIVKIFFGLSVFGLLFAMWPLAYVFHYRMNNSQKNCNMNTKPLRRF
jgi:phage shock protein PspC (stress-responsive transcriptional regulator)